MVDTAPSFDAVLIALGGGALATGVGHIVKDFAPEVEVICIQPAGAPAMTCSWQQRRVVTTDSTDTMADAVAGRFPIPDVLADLLLVANDAILVQEASIIAGMRMHRRVWQQPRSGCLRTLGSRGLLGMSGGSPEVLLTFWHGFGADQRRDGRRFKSCKRDRGQRVGRR
ncbi:pyridoxal-phosphate dependent enzyme [Mycolicibacter heraklionensis]|uniref:pyridoxal-phosphate dependent enzyme n=1 Tax=Mycolicibacter heraklionensis TaxID=512402 RepID=UPI00292D0F2A|nr:pyridoxal-phosphate dependent enzyme [Mycolicibacter heraklionensis]